METTNNGLQGKPVETIIKRFYGDLHRWPIEPDGVNWTQSDIKAVCEHIASTGDCLWHAQSVVKGWKTCHCANCQRVNAE